MSQLERNFEIDVKPNGAVEVLDVLLTDRELPAVAGAYIDTDLVSAKHTQGDKAVLETQRAIQSADLFLTSKGHSRAFRKVIKK